MKKPIVWTIAGSDSGGGAGIQADLHTFQDLGAFGCTVITAMTAQNSIEVRAIEYTHSDFLKKNLQALEDDLPAKALKIGMCGHPDLLHEITLFLEKNQEKVVIDPVMIATNGAYLYLPEALEKFKRIFKYADILTPNLAEAEALVGYPIKTLIRMRQAAKDLLLLGPRSVLIKGGHFKNKNWAIDFYSDGIQEYALRGQRWPNEHTHGAGCSLSAAITAFLAQDYSRIEALILAKSYVSRAIRTAISYGKGPGPLAHGFRQGQPQDFPQLIKKIDAVKESFHFPDCGSEKTGFYPIVPSSDWVEKLLSLGVQTIQLRLKDKSLPECQSEIQRACHLAKKYRAKLFINDYWEYAIKYQAYGVHLGQEDLVTADMKAIEHAHLRLGISTHDLEELAHALSFSPSYIAWGPLYETQTKVMKFEPCGLKPLKKILQYLEIPVVVIGGIKLHHLAKIFKLNVSGIAVISAIVGQENAEEKTLEWLKRCSS